MRQEHSEALAVLDSWALDPRGGLPEELFLFISQRGQPAATATRNMLPGIAPHDLRRSCAKMCRAAGGELEQIQLLLGHASVQTTERYLGTRQDLVHAPND
jgi:integrase